MKFLSLSFKMFVEKHNSHRKKNKSIPTELTGTTNNLLVYNSVLQSSCNSMILYSINNTKIVITRK